ncbi:hypothetical protein LOKG_00034 [Loktanella phage pCB2051-A]|uniref:Uncharacterized protein n=1 Tax=Loktanella phage pCB2051-A TaxID=754044 RepID=M4QPA7_9CAUD|nr:tail assembly protein [Loktanella phage pCB2051-A]AGH31470.1 hypothetical protein LOKG_00034 [Loktanella phage pCB2051-A]
MDRVPRRVGTIVAPFPNWSSPVREEYEFNTYIHTSYDGTEQRESMRQTPRMAVEFSADSFRALARRITADMKEWPVDGLYVLPVSWRKAIIASDVTGGSKVIGLDRVAPWWMRPGVKLVLERYDLQEVVEIESVGTYSVTLVDAPSEPFYIGDTVMLGRDARYESEVSLKALTDQHRSANLRFNVDPGSIDYTGLQATARYHEGYEAFLTKPNWGGGIDADFDDGRDTLDNGVGRIFVERYQDFTTHTQTMNFTLFERDDVDDILAFFMRKKGSKLPFFVPSFQEDAVYVAGGPKGNYGLLVEGSDFHTAYNQDEVYNHLAIQFPSGCWQFNRIINMNVQEDGNTLLTMKDKWEDDVTADLKISFAFFARLMSDTLVVNWLTDEKADIQLSFKTLPSRYLSNQFGYCAPPIIDTPYSQTWPSNWTNDQSMYATFSLQQAGLSLSAIDRGYGWATGKTSGKSKYYSPTLINYYGHDRAGWGAGIDIGFFLNYGDTVEMLPGVNYDPAYPSGSIRNERTAGEDNGSWDFQVRTKIPPGARWARARFLVQGDPFGTLSDIANSFVICTNNWGPGYDIENLICP